MVHAARVRLYFILAFLLQFRNHFLYLEVAFLDKVPDQQAKSFALALVLGRILVFGLWQVN